MHSSSHENLLDGGSTSEPPSRTATPALTASASKESLQSSLPSASSTDQIVPKLNLSTPTPLWMRRSWRCFWICLTLSIIFFLVGIVFAVVDLLPLQQLISKPEAMQALIDWDKLTVHDLCGHQKQDHVPMQAKLVLGRVPTKYTSVIIKTMQAQVSLQVPTGTSKSSIPLMDVLPLQQSLLWKPLGTHDLDALMALDDELKERKELNVDFKCHSETWRGRFLPRLSRAGASLMMDVRVTVTAQIYVWHIFPISYTHTLRVPEWDAAPSLQKALSEATQLDRSSSQNGSSLDPKLETIELVQVADDKEHFAVRVQWGYLAKALSPKLDVKIPPLAMQFMLVSTMEQDHPTAKRAQPLMQVQLGAHHVQAVSPHLMKRDAEARKSLDLNLQLSRYDLPAIVAVKEKVEIGKEPLMIALRGLEPNMNVATNGSTCLLQRLLAAWTVELTVMPSMWQSTPNSNETVTSDAEPILPPLPDHSPAFEIGLLRVTHGTAAESALHFRVECSIPYLMSRISSSLQDVTIFGRLPTFFLNTFFLEKNDSLDGVQVSDNVDMSLTVRPESRYLSPNDARFAVDLVASVKNVTAFSQAMQSFIQESNEQLSEWFPNVLTITGQRNRNMVSSLLSLTHFEVPLQKAAKEAHEVVMEAINVLNNEAELPLLKEAVYHETSIELQSSNHTNLSFNLNVNLSSGIPFYMDRLRIYWCAVDLRFLFPETQKKKAVEFALQELEDQDLMQETSAQLDFLLKQGSLHLSMAHAHPVLLAHDGHISLSFRVHERNGAALVSDDWLVKSSQNKAPLRGWPRIVQVMNEYRENRDSALLPLVQIHGRIGDQSEINYNNALPALIPAFVDHATRRTGSSHTPKDPVSPWTTKQLLSMVTEVDLMGFYWSVQKKARIRMILSPHGFNDLFRSYLPERVLLSLDVTLPFIQLNLGQAKWNPQSHLSRPHLAPFVTVSSHKFHGLFQETSIDSRTLKEKKWDVSAELLDTFALSQIRQKQGAFLFGLMPFTRKELDFKLTHRSVNLCSLLVNYFGSQMKPFELDFNKPAEKIDDAVWEHGVVWEETLNDAETISNLPQMSRNNLDAATLSMQVKNDTNGYLNFTVSVQFPNISLTDPANALLVGFRRPIALNLTHHQQLLAQFNVIPFNVGMVLTDDEPPLLSVQGAVTHGKMEMNLALKSPHITRLSDLKQDLFISGKIGESGKVEVRVHELLTWFNNPQEASPTIESNAISDWLEKDYVRMAVTHATEETNVHLPCLLPSLCRNQIEEIEWMPLVKFQVNVSHWIDTVFDTAASQFMLHSERFYFPVWPNSLQVSLNWSSSLIVPLALNDLRVLTIELPSFQWERRLLLEREKEKGFLEWECPLCELIDVRLQIDPKAMATVLKETSLNGAMGRVPLVSQEEYQIDKTIFTAYGAPLVLSLESSSDPLSQWMAGLIPSVDLFGNGKSSTKSRQPLFEFKEMQLLETSINSMKFQFDIVYNHQIPMIILSKDWFVELEYELEKFVRIDIGKDIAPGENSLSLTVEISYERGNPSSQQRLARFFSHKALSKELPITLHLHLNEVTLIHSMVLPSQKLELTFMKLDFDPLKFSLNALTGKMCQVSYKQKFLLQNPFDLHVLFFQYNLSFPDSDGFVQPNRWYNLFQVTKLNGLRAYKGPANPETVSLGYIQEYPKSLVTKDKCLNESANVLDELRFEPIDNQCRKAIVKAVPKNKKNPVLSDDIDMTIHVTDTEAMMRAGDQRYNGGLCIAAHGTMMLGVQSSPDATLFPVEIPIDLDEYAVVDMSLIQHYNSQKISATLLKLLEDPCKELSDCVPKYFPVPLTENQFHFAMGASFQIRLSISWTQFKNLKVSFSGLPGRQLELEWKSNSLVLKSGKNVADTIVAPLVLATNVIYEMVLTYTAGRHSLVVDILNPNKVHYRSAFHVAFDRLLGGSQIIVSNVQTTSQTIYEYTASQASLDMSQTRILYESSQALRALPLSGLGLDSLKRQDILEYTFLVQLRDSCGMRSTASDGSLQFTMRSKKNRAVACSVKLESLVSLKQSPYEWGMYRLFYGCQHPGAYEVLLNGSVVGQVALMPSEK